MYLCMTMSDKCPFCNYLLKTGSHTRKKSRYSNILTQFLFVYLSNKTADNLVDTHHTIIFAYNEV